MIVTRVEADYSAGLNELNTAFQCHHDEFIPVDFFEYISKNCHDIMETEDYKKFVIKQTLKRK